MAEKNFARTWECSTVAEAAKIMRNKDTASPATNEDHFRKNILYRVTAQNKDPSTTLQRCQVQMDLAGVNCQREEKETKPLAYTASKNLKTRIKHQSILMMFIH